MISLLRLLAVALIAAPVAAQTAGDFRDDLSAVLSAALYPVQVMAFCHREIAPEAVFRDAGAGWSERNAALLATLEDKAAAAGVPDAARRVADAQALADIEAAIAGQADKPAYCRLIARIVEAGYYDLDQRADLKEALQRIFAS